MVVGASQLLAIIIMTIVYFQTLLFFLFRIRTVFEIIRFFHIYFTFTFDFKYLYLIHFILIYKLKEKWIWKMMHSHKKTNHLLLRKTNIIIIDRKWRKNFQIKKRITQVRVKILKYKKSWSIKLRFNKIKLIRKSITKT